MEKVQNLGIVSPIPKGEWSAETTYYYLNIVRWNKASYMAKKNNVNIEPEKHNQWNEYWSVLNKDGLDGADLYLGETSDTAYAGDKGKANANAIYNIQEEQIEQNKNIATNRQNISLLMSISEQNNLFYKATVEDAFISRQTANGLTVVDPSPAGVEMIKGKTVKSTNLIPFPYQSGSTTINGVTFTQNSDGSVAVKGTATSYAQYYLNGTRFNPIVFTVGKTYTVSGGKDGVVVNTRKNDVSWGDSINGSAKTITFNDGDTYNFIGLYIASGTTVDTVIYPMLNEGDTAKPFVPYFSGLKHANFKAIKSTGKNVLKVKDYTKTYGGVTVSVKDNKFTATGTATGAIELWLPLETTLQAGTYSSIIGTEQRLFGTGVQRMYLSPKYRDYDNRKSIAKIDYPVQNATVNFVSNYMAIYIAKGNEVNCSLDLMLNIGSTAQPFEPYKVEEYGDGNTYELAEYDYINPKKGEIVKATETITITGDSFTHYSAIIGTHSITKTVDLSKYSKMYPFNQKQPCVISNGFTTQNNYFSYKPEEGVQSIKTPQIAFHTQGGYVRVYLPLEIASTEEKFIAYFNNNPLTISYELKTPTIETLDYPKEYTAYNGGSETAEQGDTDNSQWGAIATTEIKYYVLGGVTSES